MEIAIKQAVGKLPEFVPTVDEVAAVWENNGFEILTLSLRHLSTYILIPFFKNHTDPFDRLIIATAKAEGFSIMTADGMLKQYQPFVELV